MYIISISGQLTGIDLGNIDFNFRRIGNRYPHVTEAVIYAGKMVLTHMIPEDRVGLLQKFADLLVDINK